jgi:hypothetical protein
MRWVLMRCLDCGKERRVRRLELDRARQPHCLSCGGPLELSASGLDSLGAAHDARAGNRPRPAGRRQRERQAAPRLVPEQEVARCDFWSHPDLYTWLKKDRERAGVPWPEALTPALFYGPDGVSADHSRYVAPEDAYASNLVHLAERNLFTAGKPYYKVWPSIAAALCDTEMRIPGSQFALPFPGLEVRLPKQDNPLAPACAAVCCRLDPSVRGDTDRDWSFVVCFFDNVPEFQTRDDAGQYYLADIPIRANQLLEDSLNETRLMREVPNPDLIRRLVRVCVGVCFFGMDQHELILPELTRRTIEHFQRERRQPTAREGEKALAEARHCGLFGWKVGSEVDLPRPIHAQAPARDGLPTAEHGGLTAGYVRGYHMRLAAVGPGRQEKRLVFVKTHRVRPDLPLQTTHGYRVRP